MSSVEKKQPIPRATKAQVEAQRAEALRLRAEGLTLAAIGERMGLSESRAGELLRPVPPNHCRACGGPIEQRKQYHLRCRPSHQEANGRPTGPAPQGMPERQYGLWAVLGYSHAGMWLCRCRCGIELPVAGRTLRNGTSRGCRSCAAKERWAKVTKARKRPAGETPRGKT